MSNSSAELSIRQRQREQTRGQILTAAVGRFASVGYEAASLADIAALGGVKKALVQYHFSTKEELWKSAAEQVWEGRNDQLRDVVSRKCDSDLSARMREGFTALVEYTRENPEWLWFMFHEAATPGPRLEWLKQRYLQQDYRLGEKFIVLFQEQGLIRQGSPLQLLHLISGALTYNLLVASQTQLVTGVDLASAESIDEQVALLQSLLAP